MSALAEALPCHERLANLRAQYVSDQAASARMLRECENRVSGLRHELAEAKMALREAQEATR